MDSAFDRCIATRTCTIDADPALIDKPLRCNPMDAIDEVILHAPIPLAKTIFLKLSSIAARAAVFDLQYRITVISKKLGDRIKTPGVTDTERASVRINDKWQFTCGTFGQGEIAVHKRSIAG